MSVSLGGVTIFVFIVLLLLLLQISRCGFPVYLCLDWCLRRFAGHESPHLGVCCPGVPMPPWWARLARGGSAWAWAGPVSACAQLASRGPALHQGALVRGQKVLGSALGSAKASGQAGSGMQGSQSNSTGRQARGPGPTGTAESKNQFTSVKVLCKYTQVLPSCRNISATRRTRTAQTCTRRAHSRSHDLLSSVHRKHIMHLPMQTIIKKA